MPPPRKELPLTWKRHYASWKDGCGHDLCSQARKVVLGRGRVPCEVLFIGEAPGESEDVIGEPFVGPAGHLMDRIIAKAIGGRFTYALTNLVGCMPRDDSGRKQKGELDDDQVAFCTIRLQEFVRLADGSNERIKLIVAVGKQPETWIKPGYKYSIGFHRRIPHTAIVHPSHILSGLNVANQGIAIHQCIIRIQTALDNLDSQIMTAEYEPDVYELRRKKSNLRGAAVGPKSSRPRTAADVVAESGNV